MPTREQLTVVTALVQLYPDIYAGMPDLALEEFTGTLPQRSGGGKAMQPVSMLMAPLSPGRGSDVTISGPMCPLLPLHQQRAAGGGELSGAALCLLLLLLVLLLLLLLLLMFCTAQ